MSDLQSLPKFRLAAIDLDGTLLGADSNISPANRAAVHRLQRAGVQVVLASGRHFRSMVRYAEALPGIEWLVSSQGGEVTDLARTVVLAADFLPTARVAELLQVGRSLGFSPVAFGVDGVFTHAPWNEDLKFYSDLDGHPPTQCEAEQVLQHRIFKVIWVGNPEIVEQNRQRCPLDRAGLQVVRTDARFLEFMPLAMTKASALKTLTRRLGYQAAEVIAFGDGDNDVPMFEWAGLSIAMPHGWPAAIRSAAYVASPGPADTALARGVDFLFTHGFLAEPAKSTGALVGLAQ